MATIVIARNNLGTVISIEDLGISFSANEEKVLTDFYDFIDLTESDDLIARVGAGDITINDGTNYLSIAKGLEHLQIESVHLDFIQDDGNTGIISSDLPVAGCAKPTEFQVTTSYVNTDYEVLEYQNFTDVLEWDISQPERITIKESGLYRISTCYFVRANTPNFIDTYYRIMKNDSEQLGGEANLSTYTTEIQQVFICYSFPLEAGDYITSQCRTDVGDDVDIMGTRLNIFKMQGVQGPAGPPGGSSIDVQDEGTTTTSNTTTLNFRGDGVVVQDAGNNTAFIDIAGGTSTFQPRYLQVRDTTGGDDMNTTDDNPIAFDVQDIRDTDTFNHNAGDGEIFVTRTGWYECSYSISYDADNSRKNILTYLAVNDNNILDQTSCYTYSRNTANDNGTNSIGGVLILLNAGDYVELKGVRAGDSGTALTIAGTSWLKMKLIREV